MSRPRAALPFFTIALAFIALGVASNRTFLYVGIVFLVVAATLFARGRR